MVGGGRSASSLRAFLIEYFHSTQKRLCVTCTDLLSVLTPSTKCLLPGRNVYHWRRRRSNRRLFPPCLCSLPCSFQLPVHTISPPPIPCFPDNQDSHVQRDELFSAGCLSSSSLGSYIAAVQHNLPHHSQATLQHDFSALSLWDAFDRSHTNVGHHKNTFPPFLAFQPHSANFKSCSLSVDTSENRGFKCFCFWLSLHLFFPCFFLHTC